MGWKWTNDILIREILWPVLKEWKIQGMNSKQQTTSDSETQKPEDRVENENSLKIEEVSADDVSVMPNTTKTELECLNVDKLVGTSNETMCSDTTIDDTRNSDLKSNENMDASIANILRLLGKCLSALITCSFKKIEQIRAQSMFCCYRHIDILFSC